MGKATRQQYIFIAFVGNRINFTKTVLIKRQQRANSRVGDLGYWCLQNREVAMATLREPVGRPGQHRGLEKEGQTIKASFRAHANQRRVLSLSTK